MLFVDANGNGRWDPGEEVLDGVPLSLEGEATGAIHPTGNYDTITDDRGYYRFEDVAPGSYELVLPAIPGHWPAGGERLPLWVGSSVYVRIDFPYTVPPHFVYLPLLTP